MDCLEHVGKALFARYGIAVPRGAVVSSLDAAHAVASPVVVKAQIHVGGRGRAGGVRVCGNEVDARIAVRELLGSTIAGFRVASVLVEEFVDAGAEYYVSFSYDTATRSPVLAVSAKGGMSVADATTTPIDVRYGITDTAIASCLERETIPAVHRALIAEAIRKLWRCFNEEQLLLAEVNPLFVTHDGRCIAGEAKVVFDDDVVRPQERRFLSLGGDIAILASGGGASLLNIDALLGHGGRPANYTEYSG
ncbi:MAG: acetate--CoA ligase family protein, partial [bacterium]|nr:acetate--CoA ligase family protein [bacterium]